MRVIIKNADFSVYGLADISELMTRVATNYNLNNTDKSTVENFLRALGADGSNGIWTKIKHLYMPCLALSSDTDAVALYDIMTEGTYPKTAPSTTVVLETRKGVEPASMAGNSEGIGYFSLTDGLTDSSMSLFASFTRALGHDLQSSSGVQVQLGEIVFKWEKEVMACAIVGGNTASITKPTGFESPNWIVMSAKDGGSRVIVCANGEATTSVLTSSNTTYFNLAKGYCCTSVCGVCSGLTAAEARAVSSAIATFTSSFGILNNVS